MEYLSRNCFYMEVADMTTKQTQYNIISVKFIPSNKYFDQKFM